MDLAKRCIWYLCQTHHDPWIDDDEIQTNITSGDYRLHYYASSTWLELVECYNRMIGGNSHSSELILALGSLSGQRTKWGFDQDSELSEDTYRSEFDGFKKESPELYRFLCQVAHFRRSYATSEYHIQRSTSCQQNTRENGC